MQRKILTKVKKIYTENNIIEYDHNIKVICDEIVDNIPIESIILCGSRATGQGITETSDYDMPVVMKTYLIPFYLSKLKKIEKALNRKLCINISINPLPTFRIKNAKGNLFLFKVKREGVIIYGTDYIKDLDPGEIKDIPADRYFSFLFSAAKDLIYNFDIRFLKEVPNCEESKKILYDAAKAIIYCAELRLLLNDHYDTNINNMILKLSKTDTNNFLNDLNISKKIKYKNLDNNICPVEFWFNVRDRILETFYILVKNFMNISEINHEFLINEYLNRRHETSIKNFQYLALTLIARKELFSRAFLTKTTIEDRIRIAILWILLSISEDGIDKNKLDKAYNILKDYVNIQYSKNDIDLWENLKKSIIDYYPYACTVMGI